MNYDSQGNVVQPSLITQIQRVLAFSTTTPLAANAVYTSPTVDVINYKVVRGRVFSDVAGSVLFQHSEDGVTWDSSTSTATTANTALFISQNFSGRYFRFVLTNGAAAQTVLRLSMYLEPI